MTGTLEERFEAKYIPEPNSGCWLWIAGLDTFGYGLIHIGTTRNGKVKAHRFSYELYRGPISEGKQIDHLCRVRSCVNPFHLEVVTQQENLKRGIHGRPALIFCRNGHLRTKENTYTKRGWRECNICRRNTEKRCYFGTH